MKRKADLIIETYYNKTHNFIFQETWRGYDNNTCFNYECLKCNYEINLYFWYEDEFETTGGIRFLSSSFSDGLDISYFGPSRILIDDKIDIISCNEQIIKNIIE